MTLNPVIIETNRLILKGFYPKDLSAIFEHYSKDEIMELLGHQTEEHYEKEVYKYKKGYSSYSHSFLLFLLIEKNSGKIIGRCGFHNWNIAHDRAEIGYDIGDDDFKRKGFMSEAVDAVIKYGFNVLNLHRIEALVGNENLPSLKIIEKNGFVREGLLREHYLINGEFVDSIMFSLLRDEYKKVN